MAFEDSELMVSGLARLSITNYKLRGFKIQSSEFEDSVNDECFVLYFGWRQPLFTIHFLSTFILTYNIDLQPSRASHCSLFTIHCSLSCDWSLVNRHFLYFCSMIIIKDTIIKEDLIQAHFICDLPRCKGECCVGGDAGAPLEPEEIDELQDELEAILPFMTEAGRQVVEQEGVYDYDEMAGLVTPLINDRECAFAGFHENGVSFCAIEKAYLAGKTPFRKPISCHLYPIRLTEKDGFTQLNYNRWSICTPAVRKGTKAGLPLYKFLKEPLIRRFGEQWYELLDKEVKKRNL